MVPTIFSPLTVAYNHYWNTDTLLQSHYPAHSTLVNTDRCKFPFSKGDGQPQRPSDVSVPLVWWSVVFSASNRGCISVFFVKQERYSRCSVDYLSMLVDWKRVSLFSWSIKVLVQFLLEMWCNLSRFLSWSNNKKRSSKWAAPGCTGAPWWPLHSIRPSAFNPTGTGAQ